MNRACDPNLKMKTLHSSFYWELMWCMQKHGQYTFEETIKKYWQYVGFQYPEKGLSLEKASWIIRKALIKEGCRITGIEYSLDIVNALPFYKDNCGQWSEHKSNIIFFNKEAEMAKLKLKTPIYRKAGSVTEKLEKAEKAKAKSKAKDQKPVKPVEPAKAEKAVKTEKVEKPKKEKNEITLVPKPSRETTALKGRTLACELLLKRKMTDAEIIKQVKTDAEYVITDFNWIRNQLNRGAFLNYGFKKPDTPVEEIKNGKAAPSGKAAPVSVKKTAKIKKK